MFENTLFQPVIVLRYFDLNRKPYYRDKKKTINRIFKEKSDALNAAEELGQKWNQMYNDVEYISKDVNEIEVE